MEDVMIPVFLFLAVTAIVVSYLFFSAKTRQAVQATMRSASERGEALSPELINSISKDASAPVTDYRRGILLLSVSIGVAIFGRVVEPGKATGC